MNSTTDYNYSTSAGTAKEQNVLTHKKWVEWTKEYTGLADSAETWMGSRMASDFTTLSQSDLILENFLQWSKNFQELVDDLLSLEMSDKEMETYIRLLLKLDDYDKSENFADTPKDEVSQKIKRYKGPVSEEFEITLKEFCNFQRNTTVNINGFYILVILYGESRVIEVSKQWIKNATSTELSDFVSIVEQWDHIKEHPIDWSLNLLESRV